MYKLICFSCLFLAACNSSTHTEVTSDTTTTVVTDTHTVQAPKTNDTVPSGHSTSNQNPPPTAAPSLPGGSGKVYSNERFKDVRVQNLGDDQYRITGRAQVFEAAFSWVVEDGHKELKKGFEMTDAGAPEFGKFDFTVNVKKARPNSTLHLILFESSAKDGSRQHQLPVPLL